MRVCVHLCAHVRNLTMIWDIVDSENPLIAHRALIVDVPGIWEGLS